MHVIPQQKEVQFTELTTLMNNHFYTIFFVIVSQMSIQAHILDHSYLQGTVVPHFKELYRDECLGLM